MFKEYNFIEILHQGVKSNIYRAVHLGNNQRVVIKSLANPFPKPLEIARLRHEYQILEGLNIQGIPEVLSFEKNETHYGIVLKDHDGISVSSFFKDQLPEIPEFLDVACQLCQIISGIHARQIIHKDIKPANIIVSPATGQVQLIDFGLSARLLSGTQEALGNGILEGSLPYISPEQTGRMNRPIDYRSDLYSLGITLYELATGRLPFTASHPLEWVHAHLAQIAPDPRTFRPNFPEVLTLIITKLLAKSSDDRYQSAYNLLKDLDNCAKQWKEKRGITRFELATADTFGLYMMPSKLYGREEQLAQLSEIMKVVIEDNNPQLIIVSGYSGIGKTALVQEARKQITIAKGNFASGKFDQLNRGIPFYGFTLVFTQLAKQLLSEKEEDLHKTRTQLEQALGDNIQIINQLIPSFELIIGSHPAPLPLLPEEASNRFLQTLKTFVKTLARPDRPLIVFIDDLQWADIASFSLLELLAADNELQNFGLIGSYRSNEVDISHPLMQTLNRIKNQKPFHEILLRNLRVEDVCSLLSDAFKRPVPETMGLAQLLLAKTEGNPFFLTQSLSNLHDEGLIRFDSANGRWKWSQAQLSNMNITDNVVELMVSKIQKLSPQAQQVLQLAACIGNEFSLRLLASIAEPDVLFSLKQGLELNLISSMDDNHVLLSDPQQLQDSFYTAKNDFTAITDAKFTFLHDRVQQAAYSLLSEEESKKIHLALGQNLSQSTDNNEIPDNIFIICNHLNKARGLLVTEKELLRLASQNLQAGTKAIEATAYVQALDYAEKGISLLPENIIETDYLLWKGLYLIMAQCHYLLGNIQSAEKDYSLLLFYSRSRMDKLVVYRAMVDMYSSNNRHLKIIETIGAALRLFAIKIPLRPLESKMRIMGNIAEIKWGLRNKHKEDLVHAPRCRNDDHIKLTELLLEAGPSVYLSNQDLFAWMVLFEVRYALRLGNTPSSALGFTGYGMIMNTAFGDVDLAFKMAEIGEELNKEFGNPFPFHKLKYVRLSFISPFKIDVSENLTEFSRLAKSSLAAGDYLYLGLNYYNIICFRLALGHPLSEILEEATIHLSHLQKLNNYFGYDLMLCRFQSILFLQGKPLLPWEAGMPEAGIDDKINRFKEGMAYTNLMVLYTYICQINYLLNQYEENILDHVLISTQYSKYIDGIYFYIDYALFHSLAAYKLIKSQSGPNRRKLKKIIRTHLKALETRVRYSPVNYDGYYQLVLAVYHLVKREHEVALRTLQNVLGKCEERGLIHIQAIAKELIGQTYLELGDTKIANVYLKESAYDFQRWGATAKVKRMIEEHPFLEVSIEYNVSETVPANNTDTLVTESKHGLDLTSLMKSAATISGEIVLNKLLPSMISIVVENAGAQIGYLILEKDRQLLLAVKRDVANTEAEFLDNLPVNESNEIAQTIIQYTHRTHDTVLLNNAENDERFKNDVYIIKNKPKSILCIPILHQTNFLGTIYLENNLISHAFSEERVSVMKILSSQIAISLENALLYHNLEEALNKQVILTEAYSRFTPKEYISFLGHTSILDVKLGDYRNEKMTVLFADIRSYTTIAEQFTAEENFTFLSAYLEKMTEIVTAHHGMVNQLLGDGILAFFNNADDALLASIQMQDVLQNYIVESANREPIHIKVGIGLHSGEVIIGIMGNAQSMDTGIVSDTVNAAARIEGLTKHFGVNILLSETVAEQLQTSLRDHLRFIGKVRVKGKNRYISLHECFEGDELEMKTKKSEYLTAYHQALDLYCTQQFSQASGQFARLAQFNNADAVLHYYEKKSNSFLNKIMPDDWDAIESIDIK